MNLHRDIDRRRLVRGVAVAAGLAATGAQARPRRLEPLTYLLPAPKSAAAFAPFVLADALGFYAARGMAVSFVTVPGGMKVGEALSRGLGDLGGASGDTPILLRDRDAAVRGVALLGGKAFLTLMANRARELSPESLKKGHTIGVPSATDVSFYAVEALTRARKLGPEDVRLAVMPPNELWRALGQGELDAVVGTVDWGVRAERAGVALDYTSVDSFFPAMAQAILASDRQIREHPSRIRRFVAATLDAIDLIRLDPGRATAAYVELIKDTDLSPAEVKRTFRLFGRHVYGSGVIGGFDAARLNAMQWIYLERGLIRSTHPPSEFIWT